MLALAVLTPIEHAVSSVIVAIHSGLAPLAGTHAGWAWALSIVGLVAAIRVVLFPLFAKQSRNMRQMQLLQPRMKAIQRQYKDDKQTQQQELMKLYREAGVNPASGCLPLIVQGPIFFALYRVLYDIKPPFTHVPGMSAGTARDVGVSTLFGTPISAAFNSSAVYLHQLATSYHAAVASQATVRVVTAAFIVAMAVATFITSRQSMARSQTVQAEGGAEPNPMLRQQKLILYVMPLFLAVFGYRVPLGALIYWLSNNVFTLVQQHFLYRRMDAEAAAGAP